MTSSVTAYETWSSGDLVGIRKPGRVIVSSDPAVLLEFLRYSSKGTIRAFWHLDEAAAPVL